jgi:predicted RNA binding protein YcfA (HicA-like mRNA interferase family)
MPKPKRDVEAALLAKGFSARGKGGDHRFFVYVSQEGRVTSVRTKTSHSPKMRDIPDNMLGQMARQCRLSRQQFIELVECPLDRDGLEEILDRQNLLR